jgi:hypothetical protein
MALAIAAEADALVPEIGISEKVKVRGLPHRGVRKMAATV